MNDLKLGQIIYVLHKSKIRAAKVYLMHSSLTEYSKGPETSIGIYMQNFGCHTLGSEALWSTTPDGIIDALKENIVEWEE